jgi:hypothetical protein
MFPDCLASCVVSERRVLYVRRPAPPTGRAASTGGHYISMREGLDDADRGEVVVDAQEGCWGNLLICGVS